MKNRNKLGKTEYLVKTLFWSLLSMFWFRKLLFRCLPHNSLSSSKTILWAIFIVSIIVGVSITYRRRRNNVSLCINVLTPYEIYFIATYKGDMPIYTMVVLGVALFLSAAYFFLIISPQIKDKSRKGTILKRRTKIGLLGARTIIVSCLALLIVPVGINAIFGNSMFMKRVSAVGPERAEEYTISNNIENVVKFEESKWNDLSSKEKIDALQVIANIEMRYLGLPHELNVIARKLEESTIASYNDDEHIIMVNIDYLDGSSAEEMLDSLCHEAYHAYQHRLVDVYDDIDYEYKNLLTFSNVSIYKQEFSDYIDGDDNVLGYYFQSCESTARAYAREAVIEYYDRIYEYLGMDPSTNSDLD